MKEWTLDDLEKEYNLDFDKIIESILEQNAKRVILQFPDGLKQYAKAVVDYLESKLDVEFLIYLGSCFGACDTPQSFGDLGVDMIVQIGHNSLMPNYLR